MQDPGFMVRLRRIFLAGLLVLGPAALTIVVLVWLFQVLDGMLGPAIAELAGRQIPGLGLLATIAIVFVLGLVSSNVLGNRLVGAAERVVQRVPIARFLYQSTKEVVTNLAGKPADAFKQVVLLEYPRRGIWSLGFVTGSITRLGAAAPEEDLLTVFMPSTPNPTSGFLILAARSETRQLDISVEEGVRLVISGGIVRPPAWRGGGDVTKTS